MTKKLSITLNIILVVTALASLGVVIGVPDYVKAFFYQPSGEMRALILDLPLTSKGERIMRATQPALESRDAFNENCKSHDSEVYILGCYNPKTDLLHLYDIETNDMKGIVESTAAHEVLHAAWSRLPFWERTTLSEKLSEAYDKLPEDSDIRKSMKLYSDEEFFDELHSRLGTEIADLPDSLESHYANYFSDQDAIVAYHTAYSNKYKALEEKLDNLNTEINNIETGIESELKHYNSWLEELNAKISKFNESVDNMTMEEYNSGYKQLSAEISEIDTYYDNLNKKIDRYNNLISEYNRNAVRQREVIDSINSNSGNSKPPEASKPSTLTDPTGLI